MSSEETKTAAFASKVILKLNFILHNFVQHHLSDVHDAGAEVSSEQAFLVAAKLRIRPLNGLNINYVR